MNVKYSISLFLTLFLSLNIYAQSDNTDFKPSGKVIALSFFDYSSGLNSSTKNSGFDLSRALLGYKYNFHQNFEATVSIDGAAGRSTDDKVEVHVRNAFVSWSDNGFKVNVGLMGLKQFSVQQKFWGHRYAFRSQQDLAGMGHAVDIGLLISYDISPILSADFGVTNGEGYKKIRKDNSMKYGIGATLKPLEHFTFRAYADIYTSDEDRFDILNVNESIRNQFTYSFFAGYNNKCISGGLEFNKQLHNDYIRGNHILGVSAFSTVNISSKWNVYGRYDFYESSNYISEQYGWYDDRHVIIVGIEYKPLKFLRFSPNFRNYNYTARASEQYVFVSGEFKF